MHTSRGALRGPDNAPHPSQNKTGTTSEHRPPAPKNTQRPTGTPKRETRWGTTTAVLAAPWPCLAGSFLEHTNGRPLKGNQQRLEGNRRQVKSNRRWRKGHRRRLEGNRRRLEGNRRRLENNRRRLEGTDGGWRLMLCNKKNLSPQKRLALALAVMSLRAQPLSMSWLSPVYDRPRVDGKRIIRRMTGSPTSSVGVQRLRAGPNCSHLPDSAAGVASPPTAVGGDPEVGCP